MPNNLILYKNLCCARTVCVIVLKHFTLKEIKHVLSFQYLSFNNPLVLYFMSLLAIPSLLYIPPFYTFFFYPPLSYLLVHIPPLVILFSLCLSFPYFLLYISPLVIPSPLNISPGHTFSLLHPPWSYLLL